MSVGPLTPTGTSIIFDVVAKLLLAFFVCDFPHVAGVMENTELETSATHHNMKNKCRTENKTSFNSLTTRCNWTGYICQL